VFFFISLSLVLSFRHKVVDFTSRALEWAILYAFMCRMVRRNLLSTHLAQAMWLLDSSQCLSLILDMANCNLWFAWLKFEGSILFSNQQ
jgi:hypothetical protein